MRRLSGWLLRHKLLVVLVWSGVFVVGIVLSPTVTQRMSSSFTLSGQAGFEANRAIVDAYGTGGHSHPTVPVITLPAGTTVDDTRAALGRGFADVARALPARVLSYATTGDRRFVGTDGRTTFGLVYRADDGVDDPDTVIATTLRSALPAGTEVRVSGIGQLTRHTGSGGGAEVLTLTLIGTVGALVVLAFVFGSLLALVPLLVAAVSILATLLLVGLLTVFTEVNLIVEYLVALIGLGVAIDYSLLLVTRWREEQAQGRTGAEAVHGAMASAGRAVVLSGTTVGIGLLSLVVLPVPFLRSVGYAGLLIPLLSVLVTITLLPVLLAVAGRRLDWPHRRRSASASRGWTAWARGVVRSRWVAAAGAVVGLAVLGGFAFGLQVGAARADALARSGPAHDGLVALRDAGVPAGVLNPIEVLLPAGTDAGTDAGAVAARLAGLPGVWTSVAPDDPAWRRGGTALVEVAPVAEPGGDAGHATVERIRAAVAADGGRVGGVAPEDADFANALYGRFPLMVALIALVTFVLLARAFRSLLLAAKAVLVDLLSVAAVFGAIVLVWQFGHGARVLGGVGATGALDAYVPMFVFAFLFGLSMDYEVFLLSRMREAYDRGGSTTHAVVEGVGRTGRLVTSAALIMFLAFASLAGAQDTVTKVFATGLGAGILLDATVVRSLLVPALVAMFGRWNWWLPAWAARPLRVEPSPARDRREPVEAAVGSTA